MRRDTGAVGTTVNILLRIDAQPIHMNERVVLLRGVNVGGHKVFRPAALAEQLKHLDVVNIGAAGTFVVRKSMSRVVLQAEFERLLPFDAQIIVSQGHHFVELISRNPFTDVPVRPDTVRFVSVLSGRPRSEPSLPMSMPSTGRWLLRILAREGRFVFGVYRRHMKAISFLGTLDRLFGVPVTTRNWNTINEIARVVATKPVASAERYAKNGATHPRRRNTQ